MTGDDLVEAKLGVMGVPFQRKRPDGSPMFARAFLGLAQGTVRGRWVVSSCCRFFRKSRKHPAF
jgi:hypothetical protein